jgi:hypothetical protein
MWHGIPPDNLVVAMALNGRKFYTLKKKLLVEDGLY